MKESPNKTVAEVVWPWRDGTEKAEAAAVRERRIRSLVQALILVCSGMLFTYYFEFEMSNHMGRIAFGLAATVFIAGQFVPLLHEFLQWAVYGFAHLAGVATTWILLVPFFYLCFTFGRVVLLFRGKDPMCRDYPTDAPSYWVPHKNRPSEHLERQF